MHNRRPFYILLCAVLLSALTLMLCSAALGIGRYDAVPLQTAGSSEVLPDHTVRFAIPLPEEARREHMVFCFRCYNCVVRVLDGETLLLSSGADRVAAGRPIGHMLLSVPVPEDAWGRELTVLAAAQDGTDTASISSPVLMPASDARLYPLFNKQFDFLIFLPVTLLSLAAARVPFAAHASGARAAAASGLHRHPHRHPQPAGSGAARRGAVRTGGGKERRALL